MIKFWDKIAEGLAAGWLGKFLLRPAVFLGIGFLAFLWRFGFESFQQWVGQVSYTDSLIIAAAGLLLLSIFEWLARQLTTPALRLLQGDWPLWFRGLSHVLSKQVYRKVQAKRGELQVLASRFADLTPVELDEYSRLDEKSLSYPTQKNHFRPTRIGNLMAAAEEYPLVRYGLEASVTWPRLWLVLSETTRKEISEARTAVDDAVRLLLWGALIAVWTGWAWWALAAALLVILSAYLGMCQAAGVYGELFRSAYDLSRFELYKSLKLELPVKPDEEETSGKMLTLFLHRGETTGIKAFK